MLGSLTEMAATLIGLVILFFTGRKLIRDAAQAEAREDIAADAAQDTIDTRERIDDATRTPLPPDAARERLRRFGAGDETGTSPER